MRFILFLSLLILCSPLAYGATASLENLYINPIHQTKSEALVIYNSANPCENCASALKMTTETLRRYYPNTLNIYQIDLAKHPEFATPFHIDAPLSLVIIRISDGAAFGYEKLDGIQSMVTDKNILNRRITEFINNFLDQ